jgi:hypothetical protein
MAKPYTLTDNLIAVYPCGYQSDYRCDTAEEARFYDDIDSWMDGTDFEERQKWLWNAFMVYCSPDGLEPIGREREDG